MLGEAFWEMVRFGTEAVARARAMARVRVRAMATVRAITRVRVTQLKQ